MNRRSEFYKIVEQNLLLQLFTTIIQENLAILVTIVLNSVR